MLDLADKMDNYSTLVAVEILLFLISKNIASHN